MEEAQKMDNNLTNRGGVERLHYMDVLKGIGILLVILQHCMGASSLGKNPVSVAILTYHMPLFFFASGFLFKMKPANAYFSGKVKTLLIPALLTQLYNFLIVGNGMAFLHAGKYAQTFYMGGQWFLYSLLYITCIHYLIVLLKNKFHKPFLQGLFMIVTFAVFFVLGFWFSSRVKQENFLATAVVGYGFFLLGSAAKLGVNRLPLQEWASKKWVRILAVLLGVILLALNLKAALLNEMVLMYKSQYGNIALFYVTACVGILAIGLISWAINHNRFLEFYGKNSLIILLTQFPIYQPLSKILLHVGFSGVKAFVITYAVTVGIEYLVVLFANRFLPVLTGKYKYE